MAYLNNYRNDYSRPVQRAAPGKSVMICAPHSEACMSMGLSGRRLRAYVLSNGAVQLYDENNEPISFPITTSEAGIFEDDKGFYAYWPTNGVCDHNQMTWQDGDRRWRCANCGYIYAAASTQSPPAVPCEVLADAILEGRLTPDQWLDAMVNAVRDTDTPAEAARAAGAAERDLVVRIQEGQ